MIEHAGWRAACFVYAGLHLSWFCRCRWPLSARRPSPERLRWRTAGPKETPPIHNEMLIFALLAAVLSIAAGVGSIVVVQLLIFLQARGLDFAVAVSLGTLFGPAQVGARVVERLFGSHYYPVWTMIASCTLMAVGLRCSTARCPRC